MRSSSCEARVVNTLGSAAKMSLSEMSERKGIRLLLICAPAASNTALARAE